MVDESKVKAGELGCVEVVAEAMSTHVSNANVCELGCRALWSMTTNNGKGADR